MQSLSTIQSSKPYLLKAIFDWIVDNDCTPHVVVNAYAKDVELPLDFVQDGQIVLNVAPRAVRDFQLTPEFISFNARFGGVPTDVFAPVQAVLGIYARENGQGMMFERDDLDGPDDPSPSKTSRPTAIKSNKNDAPSKPSLRIIK